jgi:alcohol dehydrogenase (cytochrome c)
VFVGRGDGRLLALDASDGSWLWEFQTGAGVNAPSSVFEHNGPEYVAVYSAGNLFAGSPKGDSVWLFALHGEMQPVDPALVHLPGSVDPDVALAGLDPATADLEGGQRIYSQVCSICHADSGAGGHDGVPLADATDARANARIIFAGLNGMPAFGSVYSAEQIRDLGAYVATLSDKLRAH